MSTIQRITAKPHKSTSNLVTKIFQREQEGTKRFAPSVSNRSATLVMADLSVRRERAPAIQRKPEWRMAEYRQAYLEESIDQGIAWQIRLNRRARGWSQTELAERVGTQQSAISRLEDPCYGGHSIEMLTQIAHAFDCALVVKFASYAILAEESEHLSEADQVVPGFENMMELTYGK